VLQITVAGHPDLTFDSRNAIEIRPDGTFSYPFGGEIVAEGKTVEEVSEALLEALRHQLRDPQVAVNVIKYRAEEIYVLGEVNRPGAYELPKDRDIGIPEAIALGEGLTYSASRETARLFRASEAPKLIDLRTVLAGASETIPLQPGDTLVIERRNMVSVIGQVEKSGSYQLPDDGKVSDALAMAGGFPRDPRTGGTRANRAEAVLIRADRTIVPVNLAAILSGERPEADIRMYTGDTLLILEAKNQVAVLGAVGAPGSYYLAKEEKLSALLAMAGGVTGNADLQHVRIIGADGTVRTVNYEPVLQEGAEEPEVLCRAEDTVIVPVNRDRVIVLGAVNRPGVYTIETGDTIIDSIGKAGGFVLDKSAPENTVWVRQGVTDEKVMRRINIDNVRGLGTPSEELLVQDGDIILVPEDKKLHWEDWLRILATAVGVVRMFD